MEPLDLKKRSVKIFLGALLLGVLTIFSLGAWYMRSSQLQEEQLENWYASQLTYNFSAKIDTVVKLNQKWGYGEVFLSRPYDSINLYQEDSLNSQLEYPIRFLRKDYYKNLKFVIPNSDRYKKGDSLRIYARNNEILVFRNNLPISKVKITSSLSDRWF